MADRTTVDLGAGWLVAPAPEGGLDLRVSPRGRGCAVVGAATLALGWIGSTLYAVAAGRPLPLGIGRHDRYGRPYYRLYVEAGSGHHFLLERRLPELSAWANVVASQTGWPRRDAE